MKLNYLILGLAIISLILAGCSADGTGNVVNELPSEADSTEEVAEEDVEVIESLEGLSTKEMIEKLSQDAGLIDADEETDEEDADEETDEEDADEETDEETTTSGNNSISILNFRATPDDLSINAGDTVTWTNEMDNFIQIIIILPYEVEEGKYSNKEINDLIELAKDESYEFTFEEAGVYKWGSKTKFDKINGIITVD